MTKKMKECSECGEPLIHICQDVWWCEICDFFYDANGEKIVE